MIRVRFANNEEAAKAVSRHILAVQPPIRHLTLRLRSPDAIHFTDWWLVPSRTWPPYKHSRLLFRQSRIVDGMLFAGFHVTKGLGRQLPGIVKDDLIMMPGWYWHEFLNDVQGGVFDGAMRNVIRRSGLPVVVRLELYELNHVPDMSYLVRPSCDDSLEFTVREADCSLELVDAADARLAGLNGALNLRDLVWRVVALPKATWVWIDWLMGVRVGYNADGDAEWGAAELWHNVLEPWLRWVR